MAITSQEHATALTHLQTSPSHLHSFQKANCRTDRSFMIQTLLSVVSTSEDLQHSEKRPASRE